jgi:hypothetical protein
MRNREHTTFLSEQVTCNTVGAPQLQISLKHMSRVSPADFALRHYEHDEAEGIEEEEESGTGRSHQVSKAGSNVKRPDGNFSY